MCNIAITNFVVTFFCSYKTTFINEINGNKIQRQKNSDIMSVDALKVELFDRNIK